MPDYNYHCASCGGFTANRPMSAFAAPVACPGCGALAPRAVSAPALGGGGAPEADIACAAPRGGHPGGCACCRAPGAGARFCAEAV